MLLEGATAVVTGAAGGQGAAICRSLGAEGADVLAIDVRPVEVVGDLRKQGRAASELVLDLSDRRSLRRDLPSALKHFSSVDILICAAGVFSDVRLVDMTDDEWDRVLGVNLAAPVVITQLTWPHLRQSHRASVVMISSIAARQPLIHVGPAYQASKAALSSLVSLFALEGAPDRIRVNGIEPGPIRTRMSAPYYTTAEREAAATPLGRIGEPDDIAAAVLFLAGPHSSFITGTILNVSGGKLLG